MRLPVYCEQCIDLNSDDPVEQLWASPTDDSIVNITCSKGHNTLHVFECQRFELLFEIALHAILDRYYRDSISSFTSSLERFHEYSVRVIATHLKISSDAFSDAWKNLHLSERQLGAFVAAFLLVEGRAPPLLENNETKFRNKVIHSGKIPSRSEAEHYGDVVQATIYEPLRILRTKYREASLAVDEQNKQAIRSAPGLRGQRISRWSHALTLRDIHHQSEGARPIAEVLKRMEEHVRKDLQPSR